MLFVLLNSVISSLTDGIKIIVKRNLS